MMLDQSGMDCHCIVNQRRIRTICNNSTIIIIANLSHVFRDYSRYTCECHSVSLWRPGWHKVSVFGPKNGITVNVAATREQPPEQS